MCCVEYAVCCTPVCVCCSEVCSDSCSAARKGLKRTREGWLIAAHGFHNAKPVGIQPASSLSPPTPSPLLEAG